MTAEKFFPASAGAQANHCRWVAELYEAYSERIYRFMLYRTGEPYRAEDLTSLVFQRLMEGGRSFDPQKGALEVWLFRIARNVLTDYYRRAYRYPAPDPIREDLPAADTVSPQDSLERQEENRALLDALQTLGNKEWSIVSLKYAAGLKHMEIARILGISEKNVGVILCRAKNKLRKALEEKEWGR